MSPMTPNTLEDVWLRVRKGAPTECWPWVGAANGKGYGQMRLHGRMVVAHRLAFEAATGNTPGVLMVLHRCDNPPCCNPAHLFLGTKGDNNRDASAKRRNAHGAAHPMAKLTAAQVADIRTRRGIGERGIDLAAEFGVTPQLISAIHRGKCWRAAA